MKLQTVEQVHALAMQMVEKIKPYDGAVNRSINEKKYPEFYDGYNQIVELYEEILVHSELKFFPAKLLGDRSPNMTEEEHKYVKKNYKPVTVPVFLDFHNSIQRCWNDGNWSIHWPDEDPGSLYRDERSLRHYVENELPEYGSLESYFRSLYTSLKIKDANGVIAIRPDNFVFNPEIGAYIEPDPLRKPKPIYFSCKNVIQFDPEEFYMVISHDKSLVKKGGTPAKSGYVFETYTKDAIYFTVQHGNYEDWTFQTFILIQTGINEIPVKRIMGIPFLMNGKLYYYSQFSFAVGNLDLMFLNATNLQLSNNNCAYPIRVMIGNECEFVNTATGATCTDGFHYNQNDGTKTVCSSCQGTGLRTRLSPLGNIFIRPKTDGGEPEIKASEAIHYASPSAEILKFLEETIQKHENRSRGILHLKNSQGNTVGENTVESDNDKKANYAFIKPSSDQVFDMYQWAINVTGKYREGEKFKQQVKVTPPNTFDFYTEQDYLNDISQAQQNNLPPFVIWSIMWKFLNTLYYTERETSKRFYLIMKADRLVTLSNSDIQLGQSKGTIANWEIILHQSSINLIQEAEMEDDNFWDMDTQDQITKLQDLAKIKQSEINQNDPIESEIQNNLNSLNGAQA